MGNNADYGLRRNVACLAVRVVDKKLVPLPPADLEHGVDVQPAGQQQRRRAPGGTPRVIGVGVVGSILLRVRWSCDASCSSTVPYLRRNKTLHTEFR